MKVIFKWYDLWIGVFIDIKKERIYIFPIPMLGFVLSYSRTLDWLYDTFGERFEDRTYDGDVLDYGWQLKLFGRYYRRSAA